MYQVVDLLTSALCSWRHAASGNTCSAPMNREKQETISCVPRPPSYPFRSYDDDLAASLDSHTTQRKRRSLARSPPPGPTRPRAEDEIFPLCNEISTAAFTFPSLQLSANSGEGCATHLPNLTVVSDTGDPVGRSRSRSQSVGPTFPFTTCRRNVCLAPFSPTQF